MDSLQRMRKKYNLTQEDIFAVDKNINTEVKNHYAGTGTLFENELYMTGRTTNVVENLSTAFNILQQEIDKRNILIKELNKIYPKKSLKSYTYNELLYLTAGLYNSYFNNNNNNNNKYR